MFYTFKSKSITLALVTLRRHNAPTIHDMTCKAIKSNKISNRQTNLQLLKAIDPR